MEIANMVQMCPTSASLFPGNSTGGKWYKPNTTHKLENNRPQRGRKKPTTKHQQRRNLKMKEVTNVYILPPG